MQILEGEQEYSNIVGMYRRHARRRPLAHVRFHACERAMAWILAWLGTCKQLLTSLARPTRAPALAARYTTGSFSASACSVAARNTESSRGPKDPELKVMSLAIAMTCSGPVPVRLRV